MEHREKIQNREANLAAVRNRRVIMIQIRGLNIIL